MRKLTIGTGTMRHATLDPNDPVPASADARFQEAEGLVSEARRRGCDVLCLPELFADPSQGVKMNTWAEEIGGPATAWLARMARRHHMILVTSVALRDGSEIANTGVIYDRTGELAGAYRKVHLPAGERDVGAPGTDFPVFDVEGVRMGIQICYDLKFPEGCRILAVNGAEIIFWPTMWGGMPESHTDVLMRARAIENSVYLVASAFVLSGDSFFRVPKIHGRSCIIDRGGVVLAEVGCRTGVAVAAVEIDGAETVQGLGGNDFAYRLPHLYGSLVKETKCPSGMPRAGSGAVYDRLETRPALEPPRSSRA